MIFRTRFGRCHRRFALRPADLRRGIALSTLYAPHGLIGHFFAAAGYRIAYTPAGAVIAMIFIGLPFVVRTVQPVLEDLEAEHEEAAASLGANRRQVFLRIILPAIGPALVTGFALAFARALGEYGSVIFIAGNLPGVSEIAPLLIVTKLEQYDTAGATAIAVVMLVFAFILLLLINSLQIWRRGPPGGGMMSGQQHPARPVLTEVWWVRGLLIGLAALVLGLFLVLPLFEGF